LCSSLKYAFLSGLTMGCLVMGPLVDLMGRGNTFKLAARVLIVFGILMSISRNIYTLGICW
jgi:hypothetical protein